MKVYRKGDGQKAGEKVFWNLRNSPRKNILRGEGSGEAYGYGL